MVSDIEIEKEILRLNEKGLGRMCGEKDIRYIARLTYFINKIKKEKRAVIAAHLYQRPEIVLGVADTVGDSYKLAKDSSNFDADIIIFCGVRFMAETAKILNPSKRVFIPSIDAGCSLSDSITADDVRKLKRENPGVKVVSYINTSAEVKAESDVIVTSSSAEKILKKIFEKEKKVIFIPDKYMASNLADKIGKEIGKDIIVWDGSCIVHEKFDIEIIKEYRKRYPSMIVMAHSECPSEIVREVDFMGSTTDMIKYIETTNASHYMLVTECGLGELAAMRFPDKNFIAMCRLCPYMKMITLENIAETLEKLPSEREIHLEDDIIIKAKRSIDAMFELSH